jgi:choline dehydrogenase-like flavoprotein
VKLRAEVCILGSGVAGGVVAQELLEAGIADVLMVEAGSPVVMQDTRTWYDVFAAEANPFATHTYEDADYDNAGRTPIRLKGRHLRARGGSTLAWSGLSYRLKPEDFRLRSNTGRGLDWPIDYAELEPYYTMAESTLQVAGDASDPGHPPRSEPFPLPALPAQEIEGVFIQAMNELGFATQHACIARNSRSINGMSECIKTGTCEYCPVGARFSGDQLIARLAERPGFRLLTDTLAVKLRFSSRELASSAELVTRATGELHSVEAGSFVICAGGVESPKLLLASADDFWPRGVGNHSGHLGRFLTDHVFQKCSGRASQANLRHVANQLWFGTTASRHFDDVATQASGKFLLTPEYQFFPLRERMLAGKRKEEIVRDLEQPTVHAVQFQLEQHASEANFLELGDKRDSIGLPRTLIHHTLTPQAEDAAQRARATCESVLRRMGCSDLSWNQTRLSSHVSGTCRMSRSPDSGVVDENLKVHDAQNLHVCSSAVFPSVGAANPTVTIVALAHRLGRHLGRALRGARS